jgi:hypothetical protein
MGRMAEPFISAFSVPITVGTDIWRMDVSRAVRRDEKWVVDLVLVGPRTYTLNISTDAHEEPEIAAQTVIGLVRAWLLTEKQKES